MEKTHALSVLPMVCIAILVCDNHAEFVECQNGSNTDKHGQDKLLAHCHVMQPSAREQNFLGTLIYTIEGGMMG